MGTTIYGLSCPADSLYHLGIWHALPVTEGGLTGRFLTPKLLTWQERLLPVSPTSWCDFFRSSAIVRVEIQGSSWENSNRLKPSPIGSTEAVMSPQMTATWPHHLWQQAREYFMGKDGWCRTQLIERAWG